MENKGSSPVLGTILLIAIAVTLVGIVAVGALKVKLPNPPLKCAILVNASNGSEKVTLYHRSGDTIYDAFYWTVFPAEVGSWELDEGSGQVAHDSSGNNNHGRLGNDPTWTAGKIGNALSFDGTNDFVENNNPAGFNFSQTNEITIVTWFNLTGHADYDGIVSLNDGNCDFRIMVNPDNHPYWDPGQHSDRTTSAFTFGLDEWYHYVMTVKGGGNSRIYINGELIDERLDGVPETLPDENDILIGTGEALSTHPTQGTIDEVRIYKRVLTSKEVRQLYEVGRLRGVDWKNFEVRVNGRTIEPTSVVYRGDKSTSEKADFGVGDQLEIFLQDELEEGDVLTLVYRPSNQTLMKVVV